MTYQKKRCNWKQIRPTDLKSAFRLCKDYAIAKKRLSVPRIAELMGESEDSLYKWLSNGRMPAALIPAYEHVCGIHYVSEYLAGANGSIVIKIPKGKKADESNINDLQLAFGKAMERLIQFYRGEADLIETKDALTNILKGIVFHRENITHHEQPGLNLGGDEQ